MAEELKPAYLIAGSDRPKVDRALQRLRSRFAADAVELHAAAETTGEDVVAAANALGLFAGDGRLIVVDGVEAWKADDAKAIAAYLKAPAPATTLALVAGELKKDAPLAKAVAPTGEVLLWDVAAEGRCRRWVAEQFKLHGAKADPEACRALIELVGDDLYELATEIDKLATWAAGERDHRRRSSRSSSRRAPRRATSRSPTRGARATSPACSSPPSSCSSARRDPRSRTIPRVAAILTSHVARLRSVPGARGRGPLREGRRRAPASSTRSTSRSSTRRRATSPPDELRDATVRLAELDHALKGGSRLTGELELERALIEIAEPREPRPLGG